MKIQIKSIWDLEEMAKKPFDEHTTLISVSGGMDSWQTLYYKPLNALIIEPEKFLPVDDEDPFSELLFPPAQAEEIADFLKKHLDETDVLICQSAPYHDHAFATAIAAAVEDFLVHDDGELFLKNGCFYGYDEVYRMLKYALAGRSPELSALIEVKDEMITPVEVEEVDIDEIV